MRGLLSLLLCILVLPGAATGDVHHSLQVTIDPQAHSLDARDLVSLGEDAQEPLVFSLHPGLQPEVSREDGRLVALPDARRADPHALAPKRWQLHLEPGVQRFTLRYQGVIRHPLQQQIEQYARSARVTEGVIAPQGLFLAGSSYWYPHIDDQRLTFELTLQLPSDWRGMTQGDRTQRHAGDGRARERWRCDAPQQEIYLVAGPFTEYLDTAGGVTAMVLLREPDEALAQRYLQATHEYIGLYSELIGPYSYGKFAMVENFWETGYGMPSFTLLGSTVLRLPFILHSSYPHEILHNWWGNGVYVDYASGNWAEGLTSYLADHLISERRGEAVNYRRNLLQKYADHVEAQADFPLTSFRGRHDARSEAVGYGKTLMLFHMLRRQLGDERFMRGLRLLYERHLFQVAGFDDVQAAFSAVAEQPLDDFFEQWVERAGAPQLRIRDLAVAPHGSQWTLTAVIEQTQRDAPYALQVPLAVQLEGSATAHQTAIRLGERRQTLRLALPARPLRLDIDPEFDLFRRLHRDEIPPSVSQAMGAGRVLIVLPAQAEAPLRDAYRALAESWRQSRVADIDIAVDAELAKLPDDRAVWLFGWRNRFRPQLEQALQDYPFSSDDTRVRIGGTAFDSDSTSLVVLARHPRAPQHALGWLAAQSAAAVPNVGRKLPHYGSSSYLAFEGAQAHNRLKGQWPVVGSPLSVPAQPRSLAPQIDRPLSSVPVAPREGPQRSTEPARLAPRRSLDRLGGRPVGPLRPQQ